MTADVEDLSTIAPITRRSRVNPTCEWRCGSQRESKTAAPSLDGVAPHVDIVWHANGFEFAGNDEIEHVRVSMPSTGAASGQRRSATVAAMARTYSTASHVGRPRCRQ